MKTRAHFRGGSFDGVTRDLPGAFPAWRVPERPLLTSIAACRPPDEPLSVIPSFPVVEYRPTARWVVDGERHAIYEPSG